MERQGDRRDAAFEAYLNVLSDAIAMGHAKRIAPFCDYCTGLLMPLERKSVEPLAAATAPEQVSAQHQSLLHLVGEAPWFDEKLLSKVCDVVLPRIVERGGWSAP
ncbi:transposase [Jiella marina]|uniref:transposase n=1 Tax=Jiella sp. LLJ827 TaxID=2917712 RepID=UPI002101A735|nr:transposase [Jiella sp. LLJ827]MCQ0990505.1 transposase [Jiella sp. LLJ827]